MWASTPPYVALSGRAIAGMLEGSRLAWAVSPFDWASAILLPTARWMLRERSPTGGGSRPAFDSRLPPTACER